MNDLKTRLLDPSHWMRLLMIVLVCVILQTVIWIIIPILAVVQWVLVLLNGEPNATVKGFSEQLNAYVTKVLQYINFNSDDAPFPVSLFPKG